MDKRYKPLTPHEQLELRLRLAAEIEAHPEWPFSQVIRHIRKTLHLAVSEVAKVCRVSEQMVTGLEAGKRSPRLDTAEQMLRPFGYALSVRKRPSL